MGVKRIVCLLVAAIMLICVLSACNQMPIVDKNVKPEEHFSLYKKFTDLYGTPWREALPKLELNQQELDLNGLNHVVLPWKERYAGIDFETALRFVGDDNHLGGVEYSVTYQYPEDEEKLLRDMVHISRELLADFGEASDTSFAFNWVEMYLGEQWNRDISYWQDIQVLKRLLDAGFEGSVLVWNMTPVAGEAVREELKRFNNVPGVVGGHYLTYSVHFGEDEGTVVLTLTY